jgi:hypothetical protein
VSSNCAPHGDWPLQLLKHAAQQRTLTSLPKRSSLGAHASHMTFPHFLRNRNK